MANEVPDKDVRCTVTEAAEMLGCVPQHVRDLLDRGQLVGGRRLEGRRTVRWVSRRSAHALRAARGRPLGRPRASKDTSEARIAEHIANLAERLAVVEALVGVERTEARGAAPNTEGSDRINLRFANLALLAANEAYSNALGKMRLADRLQGRVTDRRAEALDAIDEAAGQLREIVAQFHLPGSVPPV